MNRLAQLVAALGIGLLALVRPGAALASVNSDVQAVLNTSTGLVTGFDLQEIGGANLATSNFTVRYEPASSIKALHHLTAMLAIQNGTASLGEPIQVATSYTGSCPIWPGPFTTMTLQNTLSAMMWQSDNAATDAIKRRFGQAAINATAQSLGMSDTLLQARPGCAGDLIAAPNQLTLRDAATLYRKAFTTNVLTPASQTLMNQLMPNLLQELNTLIPQEATSLSMKVPAGFSSNVRVATKAGGDTLCAPDCLIYRAITGYLELPFQTGLGIPTIVQHGYTFGLFISGATDESAADAAFSQAISALLRAETHKALASFLGGIQPLKKPDLTVTSAVVGFDQFEKPVLTYTVKNIGEAAAGTFTVTVSDHTGSQQVVVTGLAIGASKQFTHKLPIWCNAKTGGGQTWHANIHADSAFDLQEANETNNTAAVSYNSCPF